jgi:hypothetical protein
MLMDVDPSKQAHFHEASDVSRKSGRHIVLKAMIVTLIYF